MSSQMLKRSAHSGLRNRLASAEGALLFQPGATPQDWSLYILGEPRPLRSEARPKGAELSRTLTSASNRTLAFPYDRPTASAPAMLHSHVRVRGRRPRARPQAASTLPPSSESPEINRRVTKLPPRRERCAHNYTDRANKRLISLTFVPCSSGRLSRFTNCVRPGPTRKASTNR